MAKQNYTPNLINVVNEIATIARNRSIAHLYTQDYQLQGRSITLNGQAKLHFGSCSYLGLEFDPRLKEAGIDAINRYGTQFSCSRTYVSFTLYEELEELLAQIFGKKVILSTSSSMGHQAVIPIIIEDNDAVIMDQQAHVSMQETVNKLQLRGIKVLVLRHNRLDELQQKIDMLSQQSGSNGKIWYFMDSVYSMYGDLAPINDLIPMLEANRQLYLYIDDAHGMSWAGPDGSGYLLSQTSLHSKVVLATSLAKGFASAGGVFVLPSDEMYWKVKNWGGPLTYSGPQQPAVIGASIASAKIHLSPEIESLQTSLRYKIQMANEIARYYNLPLVSETVSPIFFIGLGLTKVGYNMVRRLSDDGFYVNLGIFPAVPETCTGIRITINNHHSIDDIDQLFYTIAKHLPQALREEQRSMNDIFRAFKLTPRQQVQDLAADHDRKPEKSAETLSSLKLKTYRSITSVSEKLWNDLLGDNGLFDWKGLRLLEDGFSDNEHPEDNWDFIYYIIEDDKGVPVLATFFTSLLTKDDMLAPAEVSKKIEAERLKTPYYLTSRTLMMGLVITDGRHMYLDRTHKDWKKALTMLLDRLWEDQEKEGADSLFLRDFDENDKEISEFMADHGFIKLSLPDSHVVETTCESMPDYLTALKHKNRYYVKHDILKHQELFEAAIIDGSFGNKEEIDQWYKMYESVKQNNLDINLFNLPRKLFKKMAASPDWDKIVIRLRNNNGAAENNNVPLAIGFAYKSNNYTPFLLGLNYTVKDTLNVYKQLLYHTISRGIDLKARKIYLGLTATLEKRRLGAVTQSNVAFIQTKDNLNMSIIEKIPNTAQG